MLRWTAANQLTPAQVQMDVFHNTTIHHDISHTSAPVMSCYVGLSFEEPSPATKYWSWLRATLRLLERVMFLQLKILHILRVMFPVNCQCSIAWPQSYSIFGDLLAFKLCTSSIAMASEHVALLSHGWDGQLLIQLIRTGSRFCKSPKFWLVRKMGRLFRIFVVVTLAVVLLVLGLQICIMFRFLLCRCISSSYFARPSPFLDFKDLEGSEPDVMVSIVASPRFAHCKSNWTTQGQFKRLKGRQQRHRRLGNGMRWSQPRRWSWSISQALTAPRLMPGWGKGLLELWEDWGCCSCWFSGIWFSQQQWIAAVCTPFSRSAKQIRLVYGGAPPCGTDRVSMRILAFKEA